MKRMPGFGVLLGIAVVSLISSGNALASTVGAEYPRVAPPQSQPYGASYGEWGAAWWQWALAQPASANPLFDSTGEYCGAGQSGQVWFLAGTFGGSAERTCTVPAGRALLLPVLNIAYIRDPGETITVEEMRQTIEVGPTAIPACTLIVTRLFAHETWSSDSTRFGAIAPQLTGTNGPARRRHLLVLAAEGHCEIVPFLADGIEDRRSELFG